MSSSLQALVTEALAKGLDVMLEVIPPSETYPSVLINLEVGVGSNKIEWDGHIDNPAGLDALILRAREVVRRAPQP